MLLGRVIAGRGRAVKALISLTAVSACLGAVVAFAGTLAGNAGLANHVPAAVAPGGAGGGGTGRDEAPPPRPSFIERPEATSALENTQLRFHVPPKSRRLRPELPTPAPVDRARPLRRFQCRYDDDQWRACDSPHRLGAVPPGAHAFAVRALTRTG